jgi:hypothetical protein
MNLVDNYLFVLATVERLTGRDKSTGKALWQEYRSPLEAHLRSESPELANRHLRLFAEFYGNGAHAEEND